MKLRVQVVIESDNEDDEHTPAVHDVAHIDRDALSVDTLGLQLAEAKHLLQMVQSVLIDEQVRTSLAEQVACPDCGRPRAHKDTKMIVTRTLFGTLHLRSPRVTLIDLWRDFRRNMAGFCKFARRPVTHFQSEGVDV